jgi:hypothetical protein
MSDQAEYSFIPWLRRGIATRITEAEDFATQPANGAVGRAGITADLDLEYVPLGGGTAAPVPTISKNVQIVGPGDVGAIKDDAVIRTEPYKDAVNATPGELAYVEFYDEDLPWRYTPARAALDTEPADHRFKLRPWIALFVLLEEEFTLATPHDALPILTLVANVDLPPAGEAWAWAHAQVGRASTSPNDALQAIADGPDSSLSRLMCPRRLVSEKSYHAFVVPTFEMGRLAGLGEDTSGVAAQKPSWGTTEAQTDPRYPVYYSWSFKTGDSGDFETLVRKLVAGPVGAHFGKRKMSIADAGYGLPRVRNATVELEGALRPPDFQREEFPRTPGAAFENKLEALVDLTENLRAKNAANIANPLAGTGSGYAANLITPGQPDVPDDPILTPPAYGAPQAGVQRVADARPGSTLDWLRELNLDPRSRAVAGLGVSIVRDQQDDLMERAWNQVGQLRDVNQRLRESELAMAAGAVLFEKHVVPAPGERVLTLTSATQSRLVASTGTTSVRGLVDESRVPAAAQQAAFRRVTRPQRKVMRELTNQATNVQAFQSGLIAAMNQPPAQAVSAAPPKPEPELAVEVSDVTSAVADAASDYAGKEDDPDKLFVGLVFDDLSARRNKTPPDDLSTLTVATLQQSLTNRMPANDPAYGPVADLITAINHFAPDGADAATVTLAWKPFQDAFGETVAGKAYRGVTVMSDTPPVGGQVVRATTLDDIQAYGNTLSQFSSNLVSGRPEPAPPPALADPNGLAQTVEEGLHPANATPQRVARALPGVGETLLSRPAATPRPLRPVMAYPEFGDPMFEPLRQISQDYVIPNITDLGRDTITLMEPNPRFIAALMAGLNTEMARELLWREYPTDMRGSYFRVFWDTRDSLGHPATNDIKAMDQWRGGLDGQSEKPSDALVLVIRGELLQKYPLTVVYAQEADWDGGDTSKPRVLKQGGATSFPIFHAALYPDVSLYGFSLSEETARGHRKTGSTDPKPNAPGWFFVLKERPGQVRFGMDEDPPPNGLQTWDDLSWDQISFPNDTTYVRVGDNSALAPAQQSVGAWGKSSADLAAILFQSPVMYARHAEELLPAES